MILEALVGLSLVTRISVDGGPHIPAATAWPQMSVRQKDAALLPLVQRATECILRKAAADPRNTGDLRSTEVNDLIADSIAACERRVRAMIAAHDRMYGDGSGEAFLLGPYLDVLPSAVVRQVKIKTHAR